MFVIGGIAGLAEWIIDDPFLAYITNIRTMIVTFIRLLVQGGKFKFLVPSIFF